MRIGPGHLPQLGRGRATWFRIGPQVEVLPQRAQDRVGVDHRAALPGMAGVQRHLLDDPQLVAVVQAVPQEPDRVVEAGYRIEHCVDLHRIQARGLGGRQPLEDVGQPVAARDPGEVRGVDAVQRHVDPVQARLLEPGRAPGQSDAVGGQRDLRPGLQGRGGGNHVLQVTGDQWFAAGEAHAGDAQPGDGDP